MILYDGKQILFITILCFIIYIGLIFLFFKKEKYGKLLAVLMLLPIFFYVVGNLFFPYVSEVSACNAQSTKTGLLVLPKKIKGRWVFNRPGIYIINNSENDLVLEPLIYERIGRNGNIKEIEPVYILKGKIVATHKTKHIHLLFKEPPATHNGQDAVYTFFGLYCVWDKDTTREINYPYVSTLDPPNGLK